MRSRRWRCIQLGLPLLAHDSPELVKRALLADVDGMSRNSVKFSLATRSGPWLSQTSRSRTPRNGIHARVATPSCLQQPCPRGGPRLLDHRFHRQFGHRPQHTHDLAGGPYCWTPSLISPNQLLRCIAHPHSPTTGFAGNQRAYDPTPLHLRMQRIGEVRAELYCTKNTHGTVAGGGVGHQGRARL
jgi:hypothetical protein